MAAPVLDETLASESVVALPGASASAVAWRTGNQLFVTVIAKATFALAPGARMARGEPQPILGAELHYGNNPIRSVRFTSDLAPHLGRADILFTGHGHAPTPAPATVVAARLAVYAEERAILDKTLVLQDPRGFQRMPIVYERAFGGAEVAENPLGLGGPGDEGEPTIVDIVSPKRPAGFGPIARAWPARKRLLGATPRRVLEGPIAEIPAGFDWSYFQTAPPDQQTPHLRGDESIVLGGLHPTWPVLHARLPGARGVARIHGVEGRGIPEGHELDLTIDTLRIDGDEERCTIVCRGAFAIESEAALGAMRILAAVEIAGEETAWPDPWSTPRARSSGARPAENARAGTVFEPADPSSASAPPPRSPSGPSASPQTYVLSPAGEQQGNRGITLPFGSPRLGGERPSTPAASPAPPPPSLSSQTMTLSPGDDPPGLGGALPFEVALPATSTPRSAAPAGIPGAPWSSEPVASAPPPGLGSRTMASINEVDALVPGPAPTIAPNAPIAAVSASQQPAFGAPKAAHFFHDLQRMKESDALAPLAPDAEVDLERCASIAAELAEQRVSRIEILAKHGLTNARWSAAERTWQAAIDEEQRDGGHALLDAYDAAYLTAWESFRGALEVREYALLSLAAERGKLPPALDSLAIRRTVWTRIKRRWARRIAVDQRLSAAVGQELASLRGS
jgi:hypothetical protein